MPSFARSTTTRFFAPLVSLLIASFASAATPRDQLLRYVPDDVGFCLVVNDLRTHTTALASSPFAEEFARSALGKTLRSSAELLQILKQEEQLKKQYGLDWDKLRDEIFGDALIFVYRPGPPDKPEQEQGLLLLRARDEALLANLMAKLNEKVKVEELVHQGVKYQRRTEAKDVAYFLLKGPVLLVTGQEDLLREAIALDRNRPTSDEPGVAKQLRTLGVDKSFLALWINPRAWDADLKTKIAKASPTDAARLKQFAIYWQALDGAAVAIQLANDVNLSLTMRGKPDQLPPSGRRYFVAASKPCELWRAIPDDAIFAISGRFDAPAFLDMIGEFLTTDERRLLHSGLNLSLGSALDKDFVKEILPNLGPDWGFFVAPPSVSEKSWVPTCLFAVKVAPGESSSDQALYSLLNYVAVGTVFAHNSRSPEQPMKLKTITKDKAEVKYLDSGSLPSGLRPAFSLAGGYLLLGSSPESLDRFTKPISKGTVDSPEDLPLVRLSIKDFRRFLNDRRDSLSDFFVAHGGDRADVRQKMDGLENSLQLLDRIEVRERVEANQVTFSLVVRPSKALRK